MTGSETPSPEALLKRAAAPAVLKGREPSDIYFGASDNSNYRVWGFPAELSRGTPGKKPSERFWDLSGNFPSRTGRMIYILGHSKLSRKRFPKNSLDYF